MSETLTPDLPTQSMPEQPSLAPRQEALHGEQGNMNFEQLRAEAADLLGQVALLAQAGYHEVRATIADRRMERAGERMERMDHKNAVYADFGTKYASGTRQNLGNRGVTETADPDDWHFSDGRHMPETATPHGANPRTLAEKIVISRMEKKRHLLKVERDKRKFHEKAFHIYETQDPDFYDDDRSALEIIPSTPTDTHGHKARFLGAARVAGIKADYLTNGSGVTPEERRQKVNLAKVNRSPQESKKQASHRKREQNAINELRQTVSQPILSKWRSSRRQESIADIQRHHQRAEKHRGLKEDILYRRGHGTEEPEADITTEVPAITEALPTVVVEPFDWGLDPDLKGSPKTYERAVPIDFGSLGDEGEDEPTVPVTSRGGSPRGSVILTTARDTTSSHPSSSESRPAHEAHFDEKKLNRLDDFIEKAIRDAAHAEKDARGITGDLPEGEFRALRNEVKYALIEEYLGDDADDELVGRVSRELYRIAEAKGRIPKKGANDKTGINESNDGSEDEPNKSASPAAKSRRRIRPPTPAGGTNPAQANQEESGSGAAAKPAVVEASGTITEGRAPESTAEKPQEDKIKELWQVIEDELQERVKKEKAPGESAKDAFKRIRRELRDDALDGLSPDERHSLVNTFRALDQKAYEDRTASRDAAQKEREKADREFEDRRRRKREAQAARRDQVRNNPLAKYDQIHES